MTRQVLLVHYHEIGLKGRNRAFFEGQLVRNLAEALAGCEHGPVTSRFGRIVVVDPGPGALEAVASQFGVAYAAPASEVVPEMDAISRAALDLLTGRQAATFAVSARRATKDLELTSSRINAELGDTVRRATGWRVNLGHPDVTVYVDIVGKSAYVHVDRIQGPGGLPAGSSGRVVSLLSGGIDSPVATWRVCKRGARCALVHFTSIPFTDRASVRKAETFAQMIAGWQGDTTLHVVPFGLTQREIVGAVPPALRVLVYRRFMVRVAARIGLRGGAKALVTGESLGQVASQTLENICCVQDASPLPILRPLIGDDKQEIISLARKIGTYETSILPYDDCCSMFVRGSVATRAKVQECRDAESGLDVDAVVQACLQDVEESRVARPGCKGVGT